MLSASILVAVLLLIGHQVRMRFTVFDRIYIPASVIAGVIGLAVIQLGARLPLPPAVDGFLDRAAGSLQSWPGTLIAIVFAAMLLQRSAKSLRMGLRATGCEAVMVWIIALGQTAIGLALTWLVIQPIYDVPNAFGMLIETGFAGGHGTAAAMGQIYNTPELAFPVGRDLGMLMATAGLVYGMISGILWINVAVRRGVATRKDLLADPVAGVPLQSDEPQPVDSPAAAPARPKSATGPTPRSDSTQLARLLLQLVWIFVAYLIGVGLQGGVARLAQQLDSAAASPVAELESAQSPVPASPQQDATPRPDAPVLQKLRWISLIGSFPLFIYTLFGGLLLAQLLVSAGRANLMDRAASSRITGITMDLLVVAAITTLNLEAVAAFLIPVSILFVGGALWSAFCLFVLSPHILPRSHWFELGLINYGMSTGVTATGFILLRLVDPQLRTEAAKHYALAAPLSAPFVGGGVITIGLPLLVLQRVPIGLSTAVISSIVALLIVLGMRLARGAK